MKKMIAILLAAVLVVGGLGSVAYAQAPADSLDTHLLAVLPDSPYYSPADLDSAKIGLSPYHSPWHDWTAAALATYGISYHPCTMVDWEETYEALSTNLLDAVVVWNHPWEYLPSGSEVRFLPWSPDAINAVVSQFPDAFAAQLPADTYSWQTDAIPGYAPQTPKPPNNVYAAFETTCSYRTAYDSVDNILIEQPAWIESYLYNSDDDTHADVLGPILEFSPTQPVTHVQEEHLVYTEPTYRWELPNIGEFHANGGGAETSQMEAFWTDFSVTRSVDPVQVQAGGTQVLTLSVTPAEAMERLKVDGRTDVDGLDIATFTLPELISGDAPIVDLGIYDDGRGFWIWIDDPTPGVTYEWRIEINIGPLPPELPAVEYMPEISAGNVDIIDSGGFYGSGLPEKNTYAADGTTVLGTWTWNATGDYSWYWEEMVFKKVILEGYAVPAYPVPIQDAINQAIDNGLAWLHTQQQSDGAWYWAQPGEPEQPNVGMTGFALWCFLHHSIPETDPAVSAGIDFIVSRQNNNPADENYGAIFWDQPVYETAIAILALRAANNPVYVDEIKMAADYLARCQNDEDVDYAHFPQGCPPDNWAYGGWSYHYAPEQDHIWVDGEIPSDWFIRADLSCTQFAMIGLKAAEEAGIQLTLPETWEGVWSKAETYVTRSQQPDGGFGYYPAGAPEPGGSSGRMTAAGVWCLRLAGVPVEDSRVQAGLDWLECRPVLDAEPHHYYYYLWTAARAFDICNRLPALQEGTWYADFAGYLVANQVSETGPNFGRWESLGWPEDRETHLNATEYALLVLGKAVLPPPPPPPPPVAEAGGPYLVEVGIPLTLDASASSCAEGRHIVQYYWEFGDGTSSIGSDAQVTHTYDTVGLYTAQLMVADSEGAVGTDSAMVVVYDPDAGFATGGGWFIPGGKTSDVGDFLPNIDNTSPANFGFVVKYKPGATELGGQLEFQYRQGDFNLHSKGMDWLVIVNNNWAKFQGTATIKGFEGLYPFRVDARDGDFGGRIQPDRFIIKVYAPGADPDQTDPIYKASGDLQGGNIIIHAQAYEVTTLRLQTWLQPDDPLMTPLEDFASAVEQGTEGSVRIELYPGSALVPFGELAQAVAWGDVEMGLLNTVQLRDYYPVMDAGELPFLYNDNDGLMAAVRGGIGELLSQELTAHNITALDWTTWGFFHLFSKDMMLDHPDDVVGRNIRAYGMQAEAISAWGGNPVWVPLEEIYSELDTGELDGVTNFLHTCYAYALFEVAPYFCENYAFGDLEALCINSDVWNSLDKKTREIITKATGDYVNEMMATVKQLDAEALQQIQQPLELPVPVEVYTLTPEERLVWREASQPVWDGWVQQVGTVGQQIIDIALAHNPLP